MRNKCRRKSCDYNRYVETCTFLNQINKNDLKNKKTLMDLCDGRYFQNGVIEKNYYFPRKRILHVIK